MNFWNRPPPPPLPLSQAMLIATEIIQTVHKQINIACGRGRMERYFKLNFGNRPDIFDQDCSRHLEGSVEKGPK